MTKSLSYLKLISKFLFFIVTTGILSYYGGKGMWHQFNVTIVVAAILYLVIEILESKLFIGMLNDLTKKEFQFSIKGKEYGLHFFYNLQNIDDDNQMKTDIDNIIRTSHELKILSLTGMEYIDRNSKQHFEALKKNLLVANKNIKLIIVDPDSNDKLLRNRILSVSKTESKKKFDWEYRLSLYKELTNAYPNLEIRVTNYCIYTSLVIGDDCSIIQPYALGRVNSDTPNKAFAIQSKRAQAIDGKNGYYEIYSSHFAALYQNSIPFTDFLNALPNQIKSEV